MGPLFPRYTAFAFIVASIADAAPIEKASQPILDTNLGQLYRRVSPIPYDNFPQYKNAEDAKKYLAMLDEVNLMYRAAILTEEEDEQTRLAKLAKTQYMGESLFGENYKFPLYQTQTSKDEYLQLRKEFEEQVKIKPGPEPEKIEAYKNKLNKLIRKISIFDQVMDMETVRNQKIASIEALYGKWSQKDGQFANEVEAIEELDQLLAADKIEPDKVLQAISKIAGLNEAHEYMNQNYFERKTSQLEQMYNARAAALIKEYPEIKPPSSAELEDQVAKKYTELTKIAESQRGLWEQFARATGWKWLLSKKMKAADAKRMQDAETHVGNEWQKRYQSAKEEDQAKAIAEKVKELKKGAHQRVKAFAKLDQPQQPIQQISGSEGPKSEMGLLERIGVNYDRIPPEQLQKLYASVEKLAAAKGELNGQIIGKARRLRLKEGQNSRDIFDELANILEK